MSNIKYKEILCSCLKYKEAKKYNIYIKDIEPSILIGRTKIEINLCTKWSVIKNLIDYLVNEETDKCNICNIKCTNGNSQRVECPECKIPICSECYLNNFRFNLGIIICKNCNFQVGRKVNKDELSDGINEIEHKLSTYSNK